MIQPKTISKSTAEFKPLPADVYQVTIVDVEERESTKFASTDKVMQFMWRCEVVEGDEIGKRINFFTSESWFDGGKGSNPSKLFNLFKTVYAYYEKETDLKAITEITDKDINGLIGKQLRITVTVTDMEKNKVTGFMPIKKEIAYEVKNENVAIEADIPFN